MAHSMKTPMHFAWEFFVDTRGIMLSANGNGSFDPRPCELKKARSKTFILSLQNGILKGQLSLKQGFGDGVPIMTPSETLFLQNAP